MEVLDYKKK